MHITTFSDYSLRILMYLAANDGEKATAAAIAQSYDISFNHLAKAAQWLKRHDYITSERGRNGGIRLAQGAADINIGQLLRASQRGTALVECMKTDGGCCRLAPGCALKSALTQAQEAFFQTLENVTLADVTKNSSALTMLAAEPIMSEGR